MSNTIAELREELAHTGQVEIPFSRAGQFLRNPASFLGFARAAMQSAQVIVNDHGLWANVEGFPSGGVPWAQILELHINKVNFSSYIDVSIRDSASPNRRRTLRLPHMLTVDPEDLAKWVVIELMDRGNPI